MNIEHKLYKAVREIVSSHDIIGHTFSESAIGENDEYDAEIYKRYNQGRLYLFFLEGDKSKQKGGENIMGKQKAKILQNIHNKRGFTLVEVLVVTAIIAILAAVLIPRLLGYTDRAREARAISDIRTIKTIIEAYTADEGSGIYPSGMSLDFATGLYKKGPDYIGTILQKHGIKWYDIMTPGGITDPWGKPYFYARYVGTDDNQMHYILFSTGKDGKIQTPDDIYTTDTASPTIGSIPDYQAIFDSVQSAASTYVPE